MLLLDIILVVLILGFIGLGAKDGFVHTAGRLIGAILGFLAARAWYMYLGWLLDIFLPTNWANLISFLVIFILITELSGIIFKLVDAAFHILSILPFLKSINSFLGVVLGFLEGFLILGGAIYLITIFNMLPTLATWLKASTVAHWIQTVFVTLLGILL